MASNKPTGDNSRKGAVKVAVNLKIQRLIL